MLQACIEAIDIKMALDEAANHQTREDDGTRKSQDTLWPRCIVGNLHTQGSGAPEEEIKG